MSMSDLIVVGSKVKETVKGSGCNMAGDFPNALSDAVTELVNKACQRAQANGRKTVRAEDL
jgi:histone H3/H4